EVRSPYVLLQPRGIALESGGATALVAEAGGEGASRLTRIDTATKAVVHTLANFLGGAQPARGAPLEPGGATALVTHANPPPPVALATGATTDVTPALHLPLAVALESSGTSALVADCGTGDDCNGGGRVVRVHLGDGSIEAVSGDAS